MTAEGIARGLGARKVGAGWLARCPAHADHTPSLAIDESVEGRVLLCCHAGCEQAAVINALRGQDLWSGASRRRALERPPWVARATTRGGDSQRRTDAALSIWRDARPAIHTPVSTYLLSRGLHVPPPDVLAYHAHLKHSTGGSWPAMVALVTGGTDNEPLGIHRTFLTNDGTAKAPVAPQKMMLGPCRGGAVRLADATDVVMVGEGIETCLAVMQATSQPAWAALSTAGLRSLQLPDGIGRVVVLADADPAGEAAAQQAARRWRREGRQVRVARPPAGLDFNDLLLDHDPRNEDVTA